MAGSIAEESMSKSRPTTFSDYEVRVRAYRIWERAGRPDGCAEEHWREALAELEAERQDRGPAQPDVSQPPTRTAADAIAKSEEEAA
jgi:Protein of unknown function (DUF2934).